MTDTTPARVIGTYAAQPDAISARPGFTRAVLALPGVTGLEITFGAAVYDDDVAWLWDTLPIGGQHVLTVVGATMEALGRDPGFGLASDDRRGRDAALALLARARQAVQSATESGQTVVAVEVQSAPRHVPGSPSSPESLQEALAEAAGWDWCGAALVVEHCDAALPGQPYAKGFLALDDELDVLAAVRATEPPTPVGLCVNWGRSVIEARSPRGAVDHIERARNRGLLAGLMLSGASAQVSAYGEPWADTHVPGASLDGTVGEPTSLLTPERVASAVKHAGPGLLFDGVKVSVRPPASDVRRVAHVAAVLAALP